jgi:hypothetical protein
MSEILDFISDIAWPAVFVAALIYFRKEITASFPRITEFGPGGVKLADAASDAAARQQNEQSAKPPAVNELIAGIRQYVSPEQLDPAIEITRRLVERTANKDEQISTLLHAAASLSIQLEHERTYRIIFGSQILALERMNRPGGLTEEELQEIYSAAIAAYPAGLTKRSDYDSWKGYITISLARKNNEGNYELTATGRGFLRYIIDQQLSATKPF